MVDKSSKTPYIINEEPLSIPCIDLNSAFVIFITIIFNYLVLLFHLVFVAWELWNVLLLGNKKNNWKTIKNLKSRTIGARIITWWKAGLATNTPVSLTTDMFQLFVQFCTTPKLTIMSFVCSTTIIPFPIKLPGENTGLVNLRTIAIS